MVVIEPETPNIEEPSRPVNVEPESTDVGPADSSYDDKPSTVAGYASDGFETASEGEVIDDFQEGNTHNNNNNTDKDHQHQQQQNEEESVTSTYLSSENALSDDELKQKALAQANDAKLEGNKLFGVGQYEEALSQYELALRLAPEMPSSAEVRSKCHLNRAICFFKLGKYEDTIKECTKAIELNPTYDKALLRRGEAHEKLEHYEEALADMTKILELNPPHQEARRAIVRLEPLAREKREKMKEEMIGKLKEMGNSILGRFGMSTDNFKAVKDPNTGSYSISFQR